MSASRNHRAEFVSVCAASVRRTFAAHLPLYICALLFVPATAVITYLYDAPLGFEASLFFLITVPQYMAVGLFIGGLVQFVRLARAGSRAPLRDFGAWVYRSVTSHDRPGNIAHSVVTITPLMVSFTSLKEVIPLIRPFSWDQTFEQWDRVIGFGHMPWQVLQPVLGFPVVTWAVNIVYAAWFPVMFGTLVWHAFFVRPSALRMQYLLAFALSWFLAGNVLAVVFSSAGPCYYGLLFSANPYAGQMEYLRQVNEHWPLAATQLQDRLWNSYAATHGGNIGISAMPSMHVVIAVLMAIAAWHTRRWLAITYSVFAGIIVIGSVHLAWHYAIDAIAGATLALLFWYAAGAILLAARAREQGAIANTASFPVSS